MDLIKSLQELAESPEQTGDSIPLDEGLKNPREVIDMIKTLISQGTVDQTTLKELIAINRALNEFGIARQRGQVKAVADSPAPATPQQPNNQQQSQKKQKQTVTQAKQSQQSQQQTPDPLAKIKAQITKLISTNPEFGKKVIQALSNEFQRRRNEEKKQQYANLENRKRYEDM